MPVSVSVEFERVSLAAAEAMLRDIPNGLPAAISGAIYDTAKKQKVDISRKIRDRVNIKKKDIDRHIFVRNATRTRLNAEITLKESTRLPLKYFGARQTREGVSYRIEMAGGKKVAKSAFGPKIERLGKHVFKREGKSRFPIVKLHGPSPWGVFVKADMLPQTVDEAGQQLQRNLERRVNLVLLKQANKA